MSRIAYVNGSYVPHGSAAVHIEDRGYQFADGVYEVCEVKGGRLVDETRHLDRLDRSLRELRIDSPMARGPLSVVLRETVRRNRVRDGLVYMQVTRGVARRDHAFPKPGTPPALVVTAKSVDMAKGAANAAKGVKVITLPDNRWERVDIKSVGLLPNCLAKQAAREAGAFEAWLVDADGFVTEGSSTNAWIITKDGVLVTRHADNNILKGITRTTLFDLCKREGIRIEERPFSVAEAQAARECFLTSATTIVMPIVEIDGRPVGNGAPGSIASDLRAKFHEVAEIA
ncbi:D-amino-acid transaminase [Phreatobacter sp. AB_2022a]|uniref:D-amino-acid transaminase n=1 Tax=Phreatobacter sp. AB_2022a TaxID=3003134 RepID=UPI002286EB1F|nr:D-amino-acid transaminase [Phreatobacter sp. AB_2022a]MCZ0736536.1 D-amino-acid transaminase [Phreatobacter sp. AB_2022a]